KYTYCSESEELILGYKAEEIIGMHFYDFFVPEIREELMVKTMEIFARKGLLSNMEHPCIHKNGHLVVLEKFGTPIIDSAGNLTGYRGADKDVSERILSEAVLENSIARLKEHEAELQKKNAFIQTVLDNLPLGIALNQIDSGIALYENKRFLEIYGWPEAELRDIGSFFQKVYPDEKYRTELASRIMQDIQSGDPARMKWEDCRITHQDGSVHYVNAANIPLYEQNMMVSTVFDITELQKNKEELILAKDKAEESNRLKSSFLSNMSHEIRTPMNAISGFSSLLAEADNEEKTEYAEIIQKSSSQLLTLVDDVLLLSRLQSEKLPVMFSQFSPAGLVQSVSQLFQVPGQNSNLEFRITIPEQFKNSVYLADESKIMQVLTCLASNAVKYTSEGFIEIGFNLENHLLEFFVKDTGIGISESDQEKIFDTFFRTEQAIALAIRGTGLGLNIAKELVILMGGRIGVESALGQGSRFYFTVPVEQLDLTNHSWNNHQDEESKYSDLNILLVDDELINCQLVEAFLRGLVRNIDFAFDGQEAIDKASKEKYDLVLMDIKMPGMGGLEATMIIKAGNPGIKIIAQTAFTLPEEQELAFQAGCDEVLTKPIIKKKLLEKFSKLGF
ncbi:MAG TPA: ATP-binding protein, partial [Prolixibacteraceae bacterium]|nr:ATP-binding protein [Prolixibacteraceae bacterium]